MTVIDVLNSQPCTDAMWRQLHVRAAVYKTNKILSTLPVNHYGANPMPKVVAVL